MPYYTKGKCVYKKTTDKKVGCTKGSVKNYLAALHANVNESLEYKNIVIADDKTKASVYYTLSDNPSIEIGLVFNLSPDADYEFGMIKNNEGEIKKFEDPLEAKELLSRYGLEPDDIERRGQESYEIIEDTLKEMITDDYVKEESMSFNSLYNNLMKS